MSRIGRKEILLPQGVTVEVKDNLVVVSGPKGRLEQEIDNQIVVKVEDGKVHLTRLNVYRSLNEIYAQIIDDVNGATLASCSTMDKELSKQLEGKNKTEQAKLVGLEIAKRAKANKIEDVVFDRGGYLYTGRVQALADGAREGGLRF